MDDAASNMSDNPTLSNNNLRLIVGLRDIQEALSALTFFMDVPDRISEVERRRYRCYQDMMVISYWRPFTQSSGLPKLSFKNIGLHLGPSEKKLHNRLREYRNKIVAHTDIERVRIAVQANSIERLEAGFPRYPSIAHDIGFEFLDDHIEIETWLRKLVHVLSCRIFDLFQTLPPDTKFEKDYLKPDD